MTPFDQSAVAEVFSNYPLEIRRRLSRVREMIFAVAKETAGVGKIEETLKWRQPSYLTKETKSGSTIRLDALRPARSGYGIYFHCQTTVVESFRKKFGRLFNYEGNRALVFALGEEIPEQALRECIRDALTYHRSKTPARTPIGRLIR